LNGKCSTCFGCNELENMFFKGKYECDNYISVNEEEIGRNIFVGKQMRISEVKENESNRKSYK